MEDRIIVAEYPKSGGTWLVSLMGSALSFPKRDIYHDDNNIQYDLSNHFWYRGAASYGLTSQCVIKSHELPNSVLHDFVADYIHLYRDGRDVVVSKYFYEKDFSVKNGLLGEFNVPFDIFLEKTAIEWSRFVLEWIETNAMQISYEALLKNTHKELVSIFKYLEANDKHLDIAEAITSNSKLNMRKELSSMFSYNTFVRKGVSGDWKNYFNHKHKELFKEIAGDSLIKLNYEGSNDW